MELVPEDMVAIPVGPEQQHIVVAAPLYLEDTPDLSSPGPVAIYVGIDWRVFGRHEAIRSCGEVNDLIVWFLGEGLPSVDLAHSDLS
jgi:hypothetical protein